MNNGCAFLTDEQKRILADVLVRRNQQLHNRLRRSPTVCASVAEQILTALNDEFLNHLDETWEPTEYARTVSGIHTRFNAMQPKPVHRC